LLGASLFPDPPPGSAIHHLAGPLHEPPAAAALELAACGEPFVMVVEGGEKVRDALVFYRGRDNYGLVPHIAGRFR
jgi:hypothetical protein